MPAPEKVVAIDIETSGLSWRKDTIDGVALCQEEDEGAYYKWPNFAQARWMVLEDASIPKVLHNANFDLKFLMPRGIKIKGAFYDTLLMAQLIDENQPLKLKELALKYLGEDSIKSAKALYAWLAANKLGKEELVKAPPELLKSYAEEDVNNTYKLFYVFWERLEALNTKVKSAFQVTKGPLEYYFEEAQPTDYVLGGMEVRGIKVNLPLLQAKKLETEGKIKLREDALNLLLKDEIHEICEEKYKQEVEKRKSPRGKSAVKPVEFNWSSTDQVGFLFFSRLGLSKFLDFRTATGKWKCSDEIWGQAKKIEGIPEKLAKAVSLYSEIKGLQKKLLTDIGGFNKNGKMVGLASKIDGDRVYPSFKQIGGIHEGEAGGTVNGRLSSASPNMQNQQSFAKALFIPDSDEYVFAHFDYSQIELRIAAHLSKDPKFLAAFNAGLDLHTETAKSFYGNEIEIDKSKRALGKGANFLIIFNGGGPRLQQQILDFTAPTGAPIHLTLDECNAVREAWFAKYPTYKEYLKHQESLMIRYRAVCSMFGRVRRLPELKFYEGLDFKKRLYKGAHQAELEALLGGLEGAARYWPSKDGHPKREKTLFDIANGKCRHAFNQGYNAPIQSVGASITKRSMIELNRRGFDIANQVHDSIVLQIKKTEIKEKVAEARHIMENVVKLSVPITVDVKLANSLDDEGDLYHE